MKLSRDLMSANGELLLSKDHLLDASLIEQIKSFKHLGGRIDHLYIRQELVPCLAIRGIHDEELPAKYPQWILGCFKEGVAVANIDQA